MYKELNTITIQPKLIKINLEVISTLPNLVSENLCIILC